MNKGELKAQFFGVFNRPDLTEAQQEFYIQSAILRLSRLLRTPAMEGVITLQTNADNYVQLPNNLLDIKDIYPTNRKSQSIQSKSSQEFHRLPYETNDYPIYYTRVGDRLYLWPTIPTGFQIDLYYWVTPQPLVSDLDESSLSNSAPDLIVYAACVDAAVFFVDDRVDVFETLYGNRLSEIMAQAANTELAGGSPTMGVGTTQEI